VGGSQPSVCSGVEVVGHQVDGVGAEHRGAARLEAEDETALAHVRRELSDGVPDPHPRHAELAGGDPRQPAAHRAVRHRDCPAGAFEHPDRRDADLGVEVVGERVRPEQHRSAASRCRRWSMAPEPALQGDGRECGDLAVLEAGGSCAETTKPRGGREPVDHRGEARLVDHHRGRRQESGGVVGAGT
jgi:hypothetical protein